MQSSSAITEQKGYNRSILVSRGKGIIIFMSTKMQLPDQIKRSTKILEKSPSGVWVLDEEDLPARRSYPVFFIPVIPYPECLFGR